MTILRSRTRIRAAAIATAAATLLVAVCGSCGHPSKGGVTTVDFWARSHESAFAQKLADGFNSTHSAVKVKLVVIPATSYVQKFGAAAATESAPDVASIDLVNVPFFASRGALSDITATADRLPYKNKLSPSHMQAGELNGRQYALPFSGDTSVLFYNRKLFKKAGLDPDTPPRSFTQIKTAAHKISALGNGVSGFDLWGACGGCNSFAFLPSIWAGGSDLTTADLNAQQATVKGNTRLRSLFTFLHGMWTAGDIPKSAKTDNGATGLPKPFVRGKAGMFIAGSFVYSAIKQADPNLDVGAVNLYDASGRHPSSFGGGNDVAIPSGSKHKSEAITFLKWATSAGTQAKYQAAVGVVPIRSDVAARDYATKGPVQRVLAHALAHSRTVYSLQANALYNVPNGPWIDMFGKAVWDGDITGALKDGQDGFTKVLNQK